MSAADNQTDMPVVTGVAPYIIPSDANAAIALYVKAFGAQVIVKTPSDDGKRLIHSHIMINGGPLMLSDAFPEHGYSAEKPQAFILHLQVDDIDAWWKRAVDAGLEVVLPMDKQFWGDRYGQVRDSFGILWSIGGK